MIRSRFAAFGLLSLALTVSSPAVAQDWDDDPQCDPLSPNDWKGVMDAVDKSLEALDIARADALLMDVYKRIPCLTEVARPGWLGRYARQQSIVAFFNQDEITSTRWGLLARVVADVPWPPDMTEGHPYRDLIEETELPTLAGPKGKVVLPPKKGGVFLNGVLILKPTAYPEMPGLLQIGDKTGTIIKAYWQDGAAFRPSLLTDGPKLAKAPKWWTPYPDEPAVPTDSGTGVADGGTTESTDGTVDAGTSDSGATETGTTETGTTDSGATETGTTEAGTDDPGTTNTGTADTGTADTGTTEAGTTEAGTTDSGATETSTTDPRSTEAGPIEAGPTDPGSTHSTGGGGTLIPERVPNKGRALKLGLGGGLAAAAGGLYGVAYLSAQQARKATDVKTLRSASSRANVLVLTSALLGAASIGVGTWALATDGRSVRIRVRF